MTSRDFTYWLQGSFEINPDFQPNSTAVKIIQKHFLMMEEYDKNPLPIIMTLKRTIFKENWSEFDLYYIKETINSVFEYVIDKEYGDAEMQKKLDKIHNDEIAATFQGIKPGMRC